MPATYRIIGGADTGTFCAHLICAFDDEERIFALAEFANYHYTVSGEIELLPGVIAQHVREDFVQAWGELSPRERCLAWADSNTQFRNEYLADGIVLMSNTRELVNRTEATRVAFQQNRIFLAPWLKILPYELEHAKFPTEASVTGRYQRLKVKDHMLDCLEHICSRHPKAPKNAKERKESFKEKFLREHGRVTRFTHGDRHLGRN